MDENEEQTDSFFYYFGVYAYVYVSVGCMHCINKRISLQMTTYTSNLCGLEFCTILISSSARSCDVSHVACYITIYVVLREDDTGTAGPWSRRCTNRQVLLNSLSSYLRSLLCAPVNVCSFEIREIQELFSDSAVRSCWNGIRTNRQPVSQEFKSDWTSEDRAGFYWLYQMKIRDFCSMCPGNSHHFGKLRDSTGGLAGVGLHLRCYVCMTSTYNECSCGIRNTGPQRNTSNHEHCFLPMFHFTVFYA